MSKVSIDNALPGDGHTASSPMQTAPTPIMELLFALRPTARRYLQSCQGEHEPIRFVGCKPSPCNCRGADADTGANEEHPGRLTARPPETSRDRKRQRFVVWLSPALAQGVPGFGHSSASQGFGIDRNIVPTDGSRDFFSPSRKLNRRSVRSAKKHVRSSTSVRSWEPHPSACEASSLVGLDATSIWNRELVAG